MAEQDQTLSEQVPSTSTTTADKLIDEGQKLGASLVSWEEYLNQQYIQACNITKNYTINGIQKAEEYGNKGFNEIRHFYVRKKIDFINIENH